MSGMNPIPVRANTKAEFDQAGSRGNVYGTISQSVGNAGIVTKSVYIDLGSERPVGSVKRFKRIEDETKFKLFIGCCITFADSLAMLQDETLDLKVAEDATIRLFY
jgi:hypothetical protein